MDRQKMKELVSILMESPLYMTLSLKECQSLLSKIGSDYHSEDGAGDDGANVGYEASWSGITGAHKLTD